MARANNKRRATSQGRKEDVTDPIRGGTGASLGAVSTSSAVAPPVVSPFAAAAASPAPKVASIASLTGALVPNGAAKVPGVDLASLGIRKLTKPKALDKNSKLRCVVVAPQVDVDGVMSCSIVFRCEPNDKSSYTGSWSEKIFWEAVRNRASWQEQLGLADRVLEWADNDVIQKNNKGFAIRLFELPVEVDSVPTFDTLVKIGDHICNNINATPDNKTTLTIDPDTYVWFSPLGSTVWSDVIGFQAAYLKMIRQCGQPIPGYYERNRVIIHTFFRPQSFDPDLARRIYAPFDQVHPELRSDMKGAVDAAPSIGIDNDGVDGDHHDLGDIATGGLRDGDGRDDKAEDSTDGATDVYA